MILPPLNDQYNNGMPPCLHFMAIACTTSVYSLPHWLPYSVIQVDIVHYAILRNPNDSSLPFSLSHYDQLSLWSVKELQSRSFIGSRPLDKIPIQLEGSSQGFSLDQPSKLSLHLVRYATQVFVQDLFFFVNLYQFSK